MKKNKKAFKGLAIFALVVALCGGTVYAAGTYLKWTGGETITASNDFIEKATLKILSLKQELDDLIASGGDKETIIELEKTIVLLNEEVHKANTAAQGQQQKLDWAMQTLQANGITLN